MESGLAVANKTIYLACLIQLHDDCKKQFVSHLVLNVRILSHTIVPNIAINNQIVS